MKETGGEEILARRDGRVRIGTILGPVIKSLGAADAGFLRSGGIVRLRSRERAAICKGRTARQREDCRTRDEAAQQESPFAIAALRRSRIGIRRTRAGRAIV